MKFLIKNTYTYIFDRSGPNLKLAIYNFTTIIYCERIRKEMKWLHHDNVSDFKILHIFSQFFGASLICMPTNNMCPIDFLTGKQQQQQFSNRHL